MCAGSRVFIAIRNVTASQRAYLHTWCIQPAEGVADVTREPQKDVGTRSLLHFTNISHMFRNFLSDHLEVHRHNNVRQPQYYLTFIMLLRASVVLVPCRLHCHQNMLHKIVQYVTPPFVGLLRSHKQSHENALIFSYISCTQICRCTKTKGRKRSPSLDT
jgi:hypothetical protein